MSETDPAANEITPPDAAVSEKLAGRTMRVARKPLALKEAADAASLHDGQAAPDPAHADSLARQRLAGWLAILERLEAGYADPDFDPAKAPPRRVVPPPSKSGTQLPPGVNPEDVKDPEARRAYIAAIQQNAERTAAYARNAALYQARAVIIDRAPASIADAHRTLGLPVAEAEAMITGADITDADKDALLASRCAEPRPHLADSDAPCWLRTAWPRRRSGVLSGTPVIVGFQRCITWSPLHEGTDR